ncbi:hypothetical protein DFH07DRAFT_767390 [Mycena maculata]|uniref:Uncharacterized protein n=1 Tax=Mycena maculata TaxID=230809 RepID=A0AAD7NTG8_9AGAR|nr:hypothetical protein DFH07DRAFT_767390 [Mycena maculata]
MPVASTSRLMDYTEGPSTLLPTQWNLLHQLNLSQQWNFPPQWSPPPQWNPQPHWNAPLQPSMWPDAASMSLQPGFINYEGPQEKAKRKRRCGTCLEAGFDCPGESNRKRCKFISQQLLKYLYVPCPLNGMKAHNVEEEGKRSWIEENCLNGTQALSETSENNSNKHGFLATVKECYLAESNRRPKRNTGPVREQPAQDHYTTEAIYSAQTEAGSPISDLEFFARGGRAAVDAEEEEMIQEQTRETAAPSAGPATIA